MEASVTTLGLSFLLEESVLVTDKDPNLSLAASPGVMALACREGCGPALGYPHSSHQSPSGPSRVPRLPRAQCPQTHSESAFQADEATLDALGCHGRLEACGLPGSCTARVDSLGHARSSEQESHCRLGAKPKVGDRVSWTEQGPGVWPTPSTACLPPG